MGKHITFKELEALKMTIIGGVEYTEETGTSQYGYYSKQMASERGTYFQYTDPKTGVIEAFTTLEGESVYYYPTDPVKEIEVTLTLDHHAWEALRRAICKEMLWNTCRESEAPEYLKECYSKPHDTLKGILNEIDALPIPAY